MDQTTMTRAELDSVRARQLLTAWSGPVLVVLFFLGLVAFMDFVPPPSPTNSGQAIAAIYQDNLLSMRIGIVICSFSVALLAPWGLRSPCGPGARNRGFRPSPTPSSAVSAPA